MDKEFKDKFPEINLIEEKLIYEVPHYSVTHGKKLHKGSPRLAASLSGEYTFKE